MGFLQLHLVTSVVGMMKMGNIVPRVKIEPISGQCATITPRRLPDVTTIHPHLLCMQFLA